MPSDQHTSGRTASKICCFINAQRLEKAFYSSKTPDPVEDTEPETADTAVTESDESDAVKILELLKNPETAALLKQLAKAL